MVYLVHFIPVFVNSDERAQIALEYVLYIGIGYGNKTIKLECTYNQENHIKINLFFNLNFFRY